MTTKSSSMEQMYKHQERFISRGLHQACLVWSPGTGKTRASCEWAKSLESDLTFIICPKALKENWKREVKRWGLKFAAVYTKEEFKKEYMESNGMMPTPTCLIVDEVHYFLSPQFKSQMSKCLRDYIKKGKIRNVLLASGTVYLSSPWNIFTLATLLGHKWNWREFQFKYFFPMRMGPRLIFQPKKGVEKDMARIVHKIADVVDINDCLDVPEQLHSDPEYFALTKEQEKGIKDNHDPLPIVRFTRQHQIEQGVMKGDENGLIPSQTFASDKMARIAELVKENKKVAIICRYNMQIDEIYKMLLPQSLKDVRKVYIIRGDTKNRDEITLEAEAADEAIVLIQGDTAVGFQLPSFELCIFASMSFSYVNWVQACGRFLRMDKPSRTTFMYLLTGEDSIDQAVYDSIKRKENFEIELYGR